MITQVKLWTINGEKRRRRRNKEKKKGKENKNKNKMAPGVNLSSANSILEFWLREEFRAKTQIIRESLFRMSQR